MSACERTSKSSAGSEMKYHKIVWKMLVLPRKREGKDMNPFERMEAYEAVSKERDELVLNAEQTEKQFFNLVEERNKLRADLAIVVEALEDAIQMIRSEYCSHYEPCGPHAQCWAEKQFNALAKIRGGK